MFRATIKSRKCCELRSASACGVKPLGERRLLHLQTVLVGAGEEEHILVVEAFKARDGIRGERRIGMADVWRAVRIEDRRRDVELLFPAHMAGSALG